MFFALSVRAVPVDSPGVISSFVETVTPNFWRRRVIDAISANRGRLEKCRVSSVKRHAASSGKAAFLAPLMGISPYKAVPPTIRILSIFGTKILYTAARLHFSLAEV